MNYERWRKNGEKTAPSTGGYNAAGVQMMLVKNRLEVWSPEPLSNGMTLAKIFKQHKPYMANPLLAYAMSLRKYIEQTARATS